MFDNTPSLHFNGLYQLTNNRSSAVSIATKDAIAKQEGKNNHLEYKGDEFFVKNGGFSDARQTRIPPYIGTGRQAKTLKSITNSFSAAVQRAKELLAGNPKEYDPEEVNRAYQNEKSMLDNFLATASPFVKPSR